MSDKNFRSTNPRIPLRTTLGLLALAVAACTPVKDRTTCDEMAPRMNREGFSFAKPSSPRWFLLHSEDRPDDITLRWDLHSPTHTFFMHAGYSELEREPKSHEEFAELVRPRSKPANEGKEVTRAEDRVTIDGHWCVRIETVDWVQRKDLLPALKLAMRGYRCLHPYFPRRTLDWSYTEEGLASEFSPILQKDGDQFLAGVRIERATREPSPAPVAEEIPQP